LTAQPGPSHPDSQDPANDPERTCVDAAGRDPAAFEYLYNRYFPRVYAYVYGRVGTMHDSEDLVSDIFFKALDALGRGQFTWKHEGSFAAWLFRIAHNAVASHYRQQGRETGESAPDGQRTLPLEAMHGAEESNLPEATFIRAEDAAQLRGLLALVPPRRQEIVTLKFFGGLRNREIAQALGLDERTVASQLCRALDDLQRLYEQAIQEERGAVERPK
jgi:RNA polymerase sigma-70 factor, ECF subfamily